MQRQITRNMTINVSYVGSQGHFLNVSSINPQRNNKLTSAYAALAGYNVTTGGVVSPCSGVSCGNVTAPRICLHRRPLQRFSAPDQG